MTLPKINIELTNGNLGREVSSKDGVAALIVSGVAVVDQFALGDVMVFNQLGDAEAKGIDAAYDSTNKVLAYQQIKDFYEAAGSGHTLYVMVVAQTATLTQMADKTLDFAKKVRDTANGEIRLLGLTRVPQSGYIATYNGGLDDDVITAIAKAKEFASDSFDLYAPLSIIIEGRDYQGVPGNLNDLRDAAGSNANRVSVMLGANPDISGAESEYAAYASVGLLLGRLASIPVQRNAGRVKDGTLPFLKAGMSDNVSVDDLSLATLEAIDAKGYIFLRRHIGKAGYYFNNDHCACPLNDDYSHIHRARPIDKAVRLLRQVFTNELLDDLEVDKTTGKLELSVVKSHQAIGQEIIETNMQANGEVSGVKVFVDPDQNILSTSQEEVEVSIVPKGMNETIKIKLGFRNPQNS